MTWILEDEDGNSREIDDEDEAQDQMKSLEQLGKDVELREVDDESESELDDEPEGDDVDAEVIEMSGGDGGNSTDTDDDDDDSVEIVGDGSGRTRVYCPACGRFSTKIYRCSGCGHDLAGETVDEWEEVVNDD